MANTQFSRMGFYLLMAKTYKIPDILPYPNVKHIDEVRSIFDKRLVYVIKKYPFSGLAALVFRKNDDLIVRLADWDGNNIDIEDPLAIKFGHEKLIHKISLFSRYAGVERGIYYFSHDNDVLRLVDFRVSYNKFSGPGYIRDFMGKMMPVQEVVKIELFSDLDDFFSNCDDQFIVKPSKFTTMPDGNNIVPAYALVGRD